MAVSQTSITRLPSIAKEDVNILRVRIQELEREVASYKSRLDELRKAKNNLIIKKTTEYVKLGNPNNNSKEKETSDEPTISLEQSNAQVQELEAIIENLKRHLNDAKTIIEGLNSELDDSKNLVAALRIENEDAKHLIDKLKNQHQIELAAAYEKNEESLKEVRKWESMYKEWMKMMEERVSNINRTHSVLQRCLNDSNPNNENSN